MGDGKTDGATGHIYMVFKAIGTDFGIWRMQQLRIYVVIVLSRDKSRESRALLNGLSCLISRITLPSAPFRSHP